jgi:hypothetical protein
MMRLETYRQDRKVVERNSEGSGKKERMEKDDGRSSAGYSGRNHTSPARRF